MTDPPYGIRFLGARWDYDVPSSETWSSVLRVLKPGAHVLAFGGTRTYHRAVCAIEDAGFEVRDCLMWLYGTGFPKGKNLKPGYEPIVLARKPGPLAALNIDACRVSPGRWPANVVHDGSPEVLELFPTTHGAGHARLARRTAKGAGLFGLAGGDGHRFGDEGSVARFFYCAKASSRDRGADNNHPTVKPTMLMRWLCRLVTKVGDTVIDPWMGSGSTGRAAVIEGFNFIGMERDQQWLPIAEKRIAAVTAVSEGAERG